MSDQQTLAERYLAIRKQTEALCQPLQTEDYVAQPIIDVSPPKWHLGHSTWFFENFILAPYYAGYRLYNADFNFIFNSYYESQGERILRDRRGTLTRPSTEEVYAFRKWVDEHIISWLENGEEKTQAQLDFVELGLNHEQQHQELLATDIKYILGSNPLLPAYQSVNNEANSTASPKADFIEVAEGNYTIGYTEEGFHFDNEKGVHQVFLHAFKVMNRLVTNAEFMAFMDDGGYEKYQYWLAEGWDWVKTNQAKAPFYWYRKAGEWWQFTLHGPRKPDPNAPVTHINYFEADAFATWSAKRLLTEFEWEVAAKSLQGNTLDQANFLESGTFSPMPSSQANMQFYGDAWEWTQSAYLPYPFYKQEEGALGEYNGKFMINQMVLRGGSCATPKSHFRPSYRNFFHPHLQWQFTGIRLAESIS